MLVGKTLGVPKKEVLNEIGCKIADIVFPDTALNQAQFFKMATPCNLLIPKG